MRSLAWVGVGVVIGLTVSIAPGAASSADRMGWSGTRVPIESERRVEPIADRMIAADKRKPIDPRKSGGGRGVVIDVRTIRGIVEGVERESITVQQNGEAGIVHRLVIGDAVLRGHLLRPGLEVEVEYAETNGEKTATRIEVIGSAAK